MRIIVLISGLLLCLGVWLGNTTPVHAQGAPFTVAGTLPIEDPEAVDGDVMSITKTPETLVRTTEPFDRFMYGVLIKDPVAVYRTMDTTPVIRNGTAWVNVTTMGGAIVVGDLLTGSEIAGKAKKATDGTGYMLGVALEPFDGESGSDVQFDGKSYKQTKIKVAIGIGPASPLTVRATGGLMGTLRQISQAVLFNISQSKNADKLIRYLLALLIILLTAWIAFRTFGKNVTKGIEAIGRNPLAKASIQSVIVMNIVLIAFVVVIGVVVGLLIISL